MKNIYLISAFLILCNNTFAQEIYSAKTLTEMQIESFESGIKSLKRKKVEVAFSKFNHAYVCDRTSQLGIIARFKVDSLLPTIQKKILQKWQGDWKLKGLNYDPYPGSYTDYISFKNDQIYFYSKSSDAKKILKRTEKVNFVSYDSTDYNPHTVVFKNSEIWSFWLKQKKGQKRLYPTIDRDSTRSSKFLLDERGIIIDDKVRKRELAKEIYTFYRRVR